MVRKERVNLCLDDILIGFVNSNKQKGGLFVVYCICFFTDNNFSLRLGVEPKGLSGRLTSVQCRPFQCAGTRIFDIYWFQLHTLYSYYFKLVVAAAKSSERGRASSCVRRKEKPSGSSSSDDRIIHIIQVKPAERRTDERIFELQTLTATKKQAAQHRNKSNARRTKEGAVGIDWSFFYIDLSFLVYHTLLSDLPIAFNNFY
eukprot:scaffold11639_cov172-Amphora_coffeaeformis.AAC.26